MTISTILCICSAIGGYGADVCCDIICGDKKFLISKDGSLFDSDCFDNNDSRPGWRKSYPSDSRTNASFKPRQPDIGFGAYRQ